MTDIAPSRPSIMRLPQQARGSHKGARPSNAGTDDPLFPSLSGKPDGAMLEKLKAVAFRGKLNCGHCVTTHKLKDGTVKTNRCAAGPYCGGSCISFVTVPN